MNNPLSDCLVPFPSTFSISGLEVLVPKGRMLPPGNKSNWMGSWDSTYLLGSLCHWKNRQKETEERLYCLGDLSWLPQGNYIATISLGVGKTGILSRVLSGSTNKRLLKEDYKTRSWSWKKRRSLSCLLSALVSRPLATLFDPEAAVYSRSNGWFQVAVFPDY